MDYTVICTTSEFVWSLPQKSALGIWIFSFIHVHTFHQCLSGDFSYTLSSCLSCLWQRQVSNMCNDFLLTVCKGHTGDYWLAAMAVSTSSTAKSMQMAEGQYLTVWFKQTRLLSKYLSHACLLNLPPFKNNKYLKVPLRRKLHLYHRSHFKA